MKEIKITWKREYYQPDESYWDYQMEIKTKQDLNYEDYKVIRTIGETLEKLKKEAE